MRTKVLLDTNFLVDTARFRIDLKGELGRLVERDYEAVTLPQVGEELGDLSESGNRFARAALESVKAGKIKMMAAGHKGDADEAVIEACRHDKSIIVATGDIRLRRRLRDIKIKVIYVRSMKHLAME